MLDLERISRPPAFLFVSKFAHVTQTAAGLNSAQVEEWIKASWTFQSGPLDRLVILVHTANQWVTQSNYVHYC